MLVYSYQEEETCKLGISCMRGLIINGVVEAELDTWK